MAEFVNNSELGDILTDYGEVQLQRRLPSYIEIFLSVLPKDAIFIHRSMNTLPSQIGNSIHFGPDVNNDSSPDLDVTGSPLQFTKYSLHIDDTELHIQKCWLDHEEKHYPISLNNARSIISRYLLKELNSYIPLWVVCDGSDKSRTLLLCGFKEEGWCSRCFVQYKGLFPLTCIGKEMDDISSLSSINKQRNVDVQCTFDLCDDNCFEKTLELTQNEVVRQNCLKMLVKLQWHCASLKVPPDGVSSVLAVDLNIGHKSSAIFSLWAQLNLLSKYYEMLCSMVHDKKSSVLSRNCSSDEILLEKLSKNILALINGPEDTVGSLSQVPYGSDLSHEKLRENILAVLIKQVIACMRPDCDITDKIWLLLSEFNDERNITNCLNRVFSELEEGKSKMQGSLRKKTLLSNIIFAILEGNLAVNEVSLEKTLVVMVECGMEKLKHDYAYVFKKLGVNCFNYFKSIPMSVAKSLDVLEYNMNVLAQMHVALDFILGVQFYFDMKEQNLNAFAQAILKKSCEIITSLKILKNNLKVSLEVPVMFECVVDHLPSNYSNLKLTTSSINEDERDYSVFLLSSQPIFPPSLVQFDIDKEADATHMEQQYHVYNLSCFCDFIGKP